MDRTPEERVDAYLDGSLSADEARAFERDLAGSPELGNALSSALVLRDLLRSMPPLSPPEGLEERIASALALQVEVVPSREDSLLHRARALLAGATWGVRGPAMVVGGSIGSAQTIAAGLTRMRWVLGPLGASSGVPRREAPSKPLWRRALAFAGI